MHERLVTIVGAPNVGKSTLFNRLVRSRNAIVTDEPGATRDRIYGRVESQNGPYRLVDTGGLAGDEAAPLAGEILHQVEAALREADAVLFVLDVRVGITARDREIATMLRRLGASVLLVANKADSPSHDALAADLYELGFGDPIPVSAMHASGIDVLLDAIELSLGPEARGLSEQQGAVRVALVGRPNVGKSSLLNDLVGEQRQIVSAVPGTTRDSVDTTLIHGERAYILVDTAGLRRKGRVEAETEALAVERARAAIRRADVVVLVIDATEEFAAQDAHIAGYAKDAQRPLILVINKWDLVEAREESAKRWEETLRDRLAFARESPILLVSARTGQRVAKLFEAIDRVYAAGGLRIATPALNRWLREVADRERPSTAVGRSVRLFYAAQTGVHPPRFVLFCNEPSGIHFSLRRHLENSLRERFGFGAAPIHLQFRARRAPRRAPR